MQDLLSIENFKGMVTDVSDGKQPQDTCKEIKNLVYDRDYGSLVTRYTYEDSIARPTGVSTLSKWLSFPVTYPSATDHHLWFTEDGIFQYNYWHNSSTVTNGWVLVSDYAIVGFNNNPTVTGSTTNTIAATSTDTYTSLGLSSVADYYKNWIMVFNSSIWLITGYSITSNRPTWTLDNVIDTDTGVTVVNTALVSSPPTMYRYFHKDKTFVPTFTYPAGYSTETGIRWSGGAGSTTTLKNVKSGFISKNFFANSGKAITFTGTYIDQAECSAPASSILTTSSFIVADANTNAIADGASTYDNKNFLQPNINWASNGTHTIARGYWENDRLLFQGATIRTSGSDGDTSSNYASLSTSYTNNVTTSVEQELKIKGFASGEFNQIVTVVVVATVSGTDYTSQDLVYRPYYQSGAGAITNGEQELSFKFTPAATAKPSFKIYIKNTANAGAYAFFMTGITCSPSASSGAGVEKTKTYKLWASYVYDKTQESELTYLSSCYVEGSYQKLAYEVNQKIGSLNKFVTAIRLYMSQESGNTTSVTSTTIAPRYLMATISIDSDSTSTWTFDTTQARYEYASSFNGVDWNNKGKTWEQSTGRIASASTTCSYFLAKQASGRIFLANDYDYADARQYSNRVRFTGFNGDGNPTPDIFPNINDVFIATITAGKSQEIRNIAEYEGDIVILKKSSILRLDTSNPDPFTWTLSLIKDGVGSRSSQGAYKFDKGLFFTDLYSAYLYDGYQVRDVLKGRWRNTYQQKVTSDAKAISQIVWYNPVSDTISVAYDTTVDSISRNYYEFNTDSWLPVLKQNGAGYEVQNLVATSDGVIHFAPTSVGANSSKIATTAQSALVNAVVDSGYYGMPIGKLAVPKWVYVLAQLPSTSTMNVALYGDNTTVLGQGTFTSASSEIRLYKFQVINDSPNRMIEVYIVQNGTVAPSTKELKILKIKVTGELVEEFTDMIETVTVT